MNRLSLRQWSDLFHVPKVIAKIRRNISGRIAAGECVCVYDDSAGGLTPEAKAEIMRGWPPSKVRFSQPHPSARKMQSEREAKKQSRRKS
jgi:hypothetical protein